jgi:hypothetical protein
MPKSLHSTASVMVPEGSCSAKIASRAATRRARGDARSAGRSLEPSGIQTLFTEGVPRAAPKELAMRREAMPCRIQKSRTLGSGLARV